MQSHQQGPLIPNALARLQAVHTSMRTVWIVPLKYTEMKVIINDRITTKFHGHFWLTDEMCHCENFTGRRGKKTVKQHSF